VTGWPAADVVVVDGPDALTYLDSQCAQDLAGLEVDGTAATLLLAPAGTIVALAEVRRVGPASVELEVPAGLGDAVVSRLGRFAIRAQAGFCLLAGAGRGGVEAERSRIDGGIPGAAEVARELVPHALDEALRARCVSFTKGCYPGQELVARMESRHATPPYVLRRLTAPAPLAAGDGLGDASRGGVVTSVVASADASTWAGLAVLHRRDAVVGSLEVRTGDGPVVARLR
jgi:folate-binding protein YgfZ